MAFAMLFVTIGSIKTVATLTDIGIFVAYFFVNLSLIGVRLKSKRVAGFRSPINIGNYPVLAALGAVTCFGMLFFFEPIMLLAELVVIVSGYVAYRLINRHKGL